MTSDWDAIVVGAGPAGAVAARQLALRGRRVLLLDKKRFPRRKVCGACLNHSAVTLLHEIGLGDVLRGCGGPELHQFDLRAGSRRLSLPLPSGRAVSRAVLDQRLVEAAIRAGVTFQDGLTAKVGRLHDNARIVEVNDTCPSLTSPLRGEGNEASARRLLAKVVLAADGLGHPSLCDVHEIRDRIVSRSRIGAGCELREFPDEYAPGVIHMAVGHGGYVGLVRVEGNALNIAAAFDARLVRDAGGPASAAAAVLTEAGFPAIPAMVDADWLGTPALTRSTSSVVAERLFVLGDAAGYVEPFTGEGIGWALASAVALAPIASDACEQWQTTLAEVWSCEQARLVRRRQRMCRMLAALLKSPTCVRLAMFLLPLTPRLLQPIVRGVSLSCSTRLSCASDE